MGQQLCLMKYQLDALVIWRRMEVGKTHSFQLYLYKNAIFIQDSAPRLPNI